MATTSTCPSTHWRCMVRTKSGSIGEMPPSTRRTFEFSARTASQARFTICAYALHPGSISKFQWERLFGSFQSITESTTGLTPLADVHFLFRMIDDGKTCAAQHRFRAGAIGNPPVGGIVRVSLFHKVHRRIRGLFENRSLPEAIVWSHW